MIANRAYANPALHVNYRSLLSWFNFIVGIVVFSQTSLPYTTITKTMENEIETQDSVAIELDHYRYFIACALSSLPRDKPVTGSEIVDRS